MHPQGMGGERLPPPRGSITSGDSIHGQGGERVCAERSPLRGVAGRCPAEARDGLHLPPPYDAAAEGPRRTGTLEGEGTR